MTEGKRSNSSLSAQALFRYMAQPCPDCTGRKPGNMSQKQITVCPAKTPVWTARGSGTQNMPQQATATQYKDSPRGQLLQKPQK